MPEAIRALGGIGDGQAVDLLIEELESRNVHAVQEAIEGLGHIGSPQAIPPLIDVLLEVLSDPDGSVRSAAVLAFARGGDERALPALIWIQQNDPGYSGANKVKDHATYAIQRIQERQQKS